MIQAMSVISQCNIIKYAMNDHPFLIVEIDVVFGSQWIVVVTRGDLTESMKIEKDEFTRPQCVYKTIMW